MNAVCCTYDTYFPSLTYLCKMETEDNQFGKVYLVLTHALYSVLSEVGEANYQLEVFTPQDIRNLAEYFLETTALGPMDTYFVFGTSLVDDIRCCWVKKKKVQGKCPHRVKRNLFQNQCLRSGQSHGATRLHREFLLVILFQCSSVTLR